MAKVEIKTEGVVSRIFVNGKPVEGVRNFNVSQGPGEIPILQLNVLADHMTIDSPMTVALPEPYAGLYEKKTAPGGTEAEDAN